MRREHQWLGWRLWTLWVVASTVSYSTAFPLGFAWGESLLWGWAVTGVFLGTSQWLILRNTFQGAVWWLPLTSLGVGIGAAASLLIGNVVFPAAGLTLAFAAIGAVVGLSVGIMQWLFLQRHITGSDWWIPASIVGHSLGLVAGANFPVGLPIITNFVFGLVFVGVLGVVAGAITGATLVWLLRQPPLADGVQPPSSEGGGNEIQG